MKQINNRKHVARITGLFISLFLVSIARANSPIATVSTSGSNIDWQPNVNSDIFLAT